MLNRCDFIGNLGADPEVRRLNNGNPVVNLRLAVSEKWKDGNGERQERTTWVPVVIFNEGICKVADQYLRKGSKVYVSGKFSVRKWQAQDGADRYSTEIVIQGYGGSLTMLDGPRDQQDEQQGGFGPAMQPGGVPADDGEIPF